MFSRHIDKLFGDDDGQFLDRLRNQPLDVIHVITACIGKCIPECSYLIVLGQTRRLMDTLQEDRPTSSLVTSVSLSGRIFASRVTFQSVSYLSRIGNELFTSSMMEKPLHQGSEVHRILLSRDNIGLRNIQFLDQPSSQASFDRSPWYENFTPDEAKLGDFLTFHSDVSHFVKQHGSRLMC